MGTLATKAKTGLVWSSVDKFTTLVIQFVLGIVLARILLPEDYGLIGMITIFMAISQALIDSGFVAALVQKKEVTNRDYSTVFYFNILTGIVLYTILFFSADLIANFYEEPQLIALIRVIGLNIIIIATSLIHRAILTTKIDLKTQAISNVTSALIAGVLGIYLALKGHGVWALVYQYLARNILMTLMFWFLNRWKPLFVFDKKSFNGLFNFGSKLMLSDLLRVFFNNIYFIIIGKIYKAEELGFFTRATLFKQVPGTLLTTILQSVTFPILVTVIEDEVKVKKLLVRSVRLTGFLLFPIVISLVFFAKPLILVLLTEKWLPTVLLLQILSVEIIFFPLKHINLNFLSAKGRSDLFLKLELIKHVLTILAILITFKFGLLAMTIGYVLVSIVGFFVNTYYSHKYINYSAMHQLKDLLPYAFTSLFLGYISYLIVNFLSNNLLQLIIGIMLYGLLYIAVSHVLKFKEYIEIKEFVLEKIKRT